jgi:hypothetical protein
VSIQSNISTIPWLTTAERLAMSVGGNESGTLVYDMTLKDLCLWNGVDWELVKESGSSSVAFKNQKWIIT